MNANEGINVRDMSYAIQFADGDPTNRDHDLSDVFNKHNTMDPFAKIAQGYRMYLATAERGEHFKIVAFVA